MIRRIKRLFRRLFPRKRPPLTESERRTQEMMGHMLAGFRPDRILRRREMQANDGGTVRFKRPLNYQGEEEKPDG